MLHTLRQIIDNDEKWRSILRNINKQFYHQTVTSEQIENYLSENTGKDLSKFFNQYLRDVRIPIFEYIIKDDVLKYRWSNCIKGFDMPLKVVINETIKWLSPNNRWQNLEFSASILKFEIDNNFYVATFNLTGD